MSGRLKVTGARDTKTFERAAMEFEVSRIDDALASKRFAWLVALGFFVLAVISLVSATYALLARETPPPVVFFSDKNTGDVVVMRPLIDNKDTYDDVTNKFWLARYITACESYDWYTIRVDFSACQTMSSTSLAQYWESRVMAKDAPLNVIKQGGRVRVNVTSITFLPGGAAQVRYSRETTNSTGETVADTRQSIATMTFKFNQAKAQSEAQVLVNPLRFEVLGFRVDDEVLAK
jgi:type IV secretion system protein VirB8